MFSRTLEDGGTVTSVLIQRNTCGTTQSRIPGVSTFTYLPYCFFNIISPVMSVIIASINFRIRRYSKEEMDKIRKEEESEILQVGETAGQ